LSLFWSNLPQRRAAVNARLRSPDALSAFTRVFDALWQRAAFGVMRC
jgi:hypothetical protein